MANQKSLASNLRKKLNILRGISLISFIPILFQTIGNSADFVGLLNSSGFVTNLLVVVAVLLFNGYIQYWLYANQSDGQEVQNVRTNRTISRRREKHEIKFLRRMLVLFVFLCVFAFGTTVWFGSRFVEWTVVRSSFNTASKEIMNKIPLIAPNLVDNISKWENYEDYQLDTTLNFNPETGTKQTITVDPEDPGNQVVRITNADSSKRELYFPNFTFELVQRFVSSNPYAFSVSTLFMKSLNVPVPNDPVLLPLYQAIEDGQWHELTEVSSEQALYLYVDGFLVYFWEDQSNINGEHQRNTSFTFSLGPLTYIDNMLFWDTNRDIFTEIENR